MAPLRLTAGPVLLAGTLAGALSGSPQQRQAIASPPILSEHHKIALEGMTPQQQAERLLERTTNHYEGALELLQEKVDSWRGHLRFEGTLQTLISTALNSDDLKVRAAAIEVNLAAYNVEKTPESVKRKIESLESDEDGRAAALWTLGLLGNRGVEPDRVFQALRKYAWDRDANLRKWAVTGMALLGTEATIEPLLEILHNDPSHDLREQAACGLAQSGMLDPAGRMKAVPTLINYLDDSTLDATTREWVVQALQDISGRSLGNDSLAWRQWYSHR